MTTPETAPISGRNAPRRRTPTEPSSWSIVNPPPRPDMRISTLTTAPTAPAAMHA